MTKSIKQLTTAVLVSMLALPTVGCRQDGKEYPQEKQRHEEKTKDEKTKGVDVDVDAGGTKVRIRGGKTQDEKGKKLDVDVDVKPHDRD